MSHNTVIPNLVISQRVLDKMTAAAEHFIEDETGEAMIGLLVPGAQTNGVPTLYVLDTIAPDESAVRMMHTFQQGDERQDEMIWWLQENWRVHRDALKTHEARHSGDSKWDVPLRYLGDWHKQPGYMIAPSGGDLLTALDWIDDEENGMEFLLVPILTLDHPPTTITGSQVNFLTIPQRDGSNMRIDWWYIDRKIRAFMPIVPAVYPENQLPKLAAYPWHLLHEERFQSEMALLQDDGVLNSVVLWDTDHKIPLEVCLFCARAGSAKILLIITHHDYPKSKPQARIAPFTRIGADDDMYEVFEMLWAKSEAVKDPPAWHWNADSHLLDYIRALEAALGLPTSAPKPAPVEVGGGESAPASGDGEKPADDTEDDGDD
ncbi:MAG: hypothetical protein HXY40_11875 [Chloroflexi bacterium]|nr:hypothetical protein [Chloroflexota bacterium]